MIRRSTCGGFTSHQRRRRQTPSKIMDKSTDLQQPISISGENEKHRNTGEDTVAPMSSSPPFSTIPKTRCCSDEQPSTISSNIPNNLATPASSPPEPITISTNPATCTPVIVAPFFLSLFLKMR